MKILLTIFFYPLIFCSIIYTQQKIDSSCLNDYIKKIDSLNSVIIKNIEKPDFNPKKDPGKSVIQKMDLNDIKYMASMMFKASDKNHLALMDSAYADYLRKEKSQDSRLITINRLSSEYKLQEEIKSLLSPIDYALARVAYFLRVRVENVKKIVRTEEGMIPAETPVIEAVILEVFKGTGKYKQGDRVQFYYYEFWHKDTHTFEVGKEYFVPLEPRGEYPNFDKIIALVPYLDDSNGHYPIINNCLIDKFNYFGFGKKVELKNFNKKFRDKIKEVKSW